MPATLYYTPTSCGAASYIAAFKAGILGTKVHAYEADIRTKTILSGPDKGKSFLAVNPKGNVPALVLEDGTLLNEGAAVLQWIADQAPESHLAPANGTSARYLLQSKLNYVASEVHPSIGAFFNPKLEGDAKAAAVDRLKSKYKYLSETELAGGKPFLQGETPSVADLYLWITLSWLPYVGHATLLADEFPVLAAYFARVSELPFVVEGKASIAAASAAAK